MEKSRKSGKKTVLTARYGMLIALAFVFSYVEAMIPFHLGMPGVKLGLANLVAVVGLYTVGVKGTVLINGTRIILAGFTFGNMASMIYSLSGAALSMALMVICKKTGWFGTVGISVIGGIGHNIGQLFAAAFVVRTMGVFTYLPVLLAAGTIAGTLIGLLGGMVIIRIERYVKRM